MSLQIWLPLNGDLTNNGLSDSTITTSAALTYATSGKIGKCFQSGSQYIKIPFDSSFDKLSFCMWVKPNSPTAWHNIISLGSANNRLEKTSTTQYAWYADNTTANLIAGNTLFTLNNNTWYHIAVTCDGTNVRFYLDGVLYKTVTQAHSISTVFSGNPYIFIGSRINGSNMHSGYMNDVRIYDEVLSPKEIYEISKGLTLHYPLKSQYECGLTNKYSGDYADGSSSYSEFTKTALTTERGYNYKLSYTGTGSNAWKWMRFPTFAFTVGKTYQYSCKVRVNSNSGVTLSLRAARYTNDYATSVVNISKADGLWHEYTVKTTIPQTFTLGSSTVTSNPLLEFCTAAMPTSGTVYSIDFDLKDVQVVECDNYVPFIDNDMVSDIIYDCSGYGYNSTGLNNIVLSDDSTKYNGSYNFNGSSSYILFNNPIKSSTTDFTISAWIKLNATGRTETICTMRTAVGVGIALFKISNNQFRFDDGVQTTFTNYSMTSTDWTHVVVTRTASSKKLYVNGELKQTVTTVGDLSNIYSVGSIGASTVSGADLGNYTNGNISDFRIYSTVLSDENVKALFQSPISLSQDGTLFAYEFEEV